MRNFCHKIYYFVCGIYRKFTQPKFHVGDIVWVWFGPLLVKCTIVNMDSASFKHNPMGHIFYDVDEPEGHSFCEDEIFTSMELAIARYPGYFQPRANVTLDDCRNEMKKFIAS